MNGLVLSPDVAGAVMTVSVLPALLIIRSLWPIRERPGINWFILSIGAAGSWGIAVGVERFADGSMLTLAADHTVVFASTLCAVAWFLFAVEFVHQRRVRWAAFAALMVVPLLIQVVLWSDPGHNLVYAPGTTVTPAGLLQVAPGPLYYLSIGYGSLLAVAVIGVLAGEWLTASGRRRRQLTILLAGLLVFSVGGVLTITDLFSPLDPSPIAFTVTGFIFVYALRRYQFLQLHIAGHETILDTLTDPVIVCASDERIVETNAAADELAAGDQTPVGASVDRAFADQPSIVHCLRDDHDDSAVELSVASGTRYYNPARFPIRYGRNRTGVMLFLRDITTEKRRERQLQNQTELLDQFATAVSHDLRNPLSVASGHLVLAQRDSDNEHFGPIARAHDRIDAIIDDLLTMSRAGKTVEQPEPVLLETSVTTAWDHTETAEAELDIDVSEGTTILAGDGQLLRLFENLFRNALDHNDPPLTLRVGVLETNASDSTLTGFFVEDDGSGIPEAKREEVFEHGYTTSNEGTGLGLSIVHDIAEAHGWEVSITEGADGGARFEIVNVESTEARADYLSS